MNKLFSVLLVIFVINISNISSQEINWITMSEAEKLSKEHEKPILIDVYTDWCHWCKVMDSTTYKDRSIVEYINENYYAVKLNAESNDKIIHAGKKTTKAKLASKFGVSGYPATMLIHPDGVYKLINEMKTSHAFLHILTKFHHQDNTHHASKTENNVNQIHWISMAEAIKHAKKDHKPIIIDIYTDWCHYCKVMDKNTYAHPDVISYLNDNFYAVKLNAEDTKEINYYNENIKTKDLVSEKFGVSSYPSVVIFHYKEEPIIYKGNRNHTQFLQLLHEF